MFARATSLQEGAKTMEKILVAAIVLVLGVGLCCGGTALGKVGYDSFYSSPTATSTPDPTVEKLREELDKDPDALANKLESEGEDADFEGIGEVPDWRGTRDFFIINGNRLNCEEPGRDRPTRCFRIGETKYWACNGQILRDCPECPEPKTPTPPTGMPPTSTSTQQACCTAVPPTGVPPTATNQPTATTNPPTGVPPTATWTPPTAQPTPYGTATCEHPCDDEVLDLTKREKLNRDVFGTILQTPPNGKHLPLGGRDIVVREEVRMCQSHVVNAWRVFDRVTGISKEGCVVAYRRGIAGDDSYHEVNYIASDGYAFHIESRNAGFGLQEGVSQMVLALQEARKDDGSFACRRPGDTDPARQKAQDIQFMELGLR